MARPVVFSQYQVKSIDQGVTATVRGAPIKRSVCVVCGLRANNRRNFPSFTATNPQQRGEKGRKRATEGQRLRRGINTKKTKTNANEE